MLLAHYESNNEFMGALTSVLVRYPAVLSIERELFHENAHRAQLQHIMEQAQASADLLTFNEAVKWVPGIRASLERLGLRADKQRHAYTSYLVELKQLASEWGLRAEWAAHHLHSAVMTHLIVPDRFLPASCRTLRLVDITSPDYDPLPQHRIVVDVTYSPTYPPAPQYESVLPQYEKLADPNSPIGFTIMVWHGGWDAVEQAIVKEAKRQRDDFRAQLAERRDVLITDTEPSLAKHVEWLYLRICPQPKTGRPLGWSEIARFKDWGEPLPTPSGVQKEVEPLARELGIELPPLKAGRPKKP